MTIITITSDWGLKDHYLASVKGAILTQLPEAQIIDISHQIIRYDILQCAFVIKNCYKNFPDGTIHIIGVQTEASIDTPHTLVYHDKQYFIGADNGVFSLIFDPAPSEIIELNVIQESDYFTFSTRDVFVKVACEIAKGKAITSMGIKKNILKHRLMFNPIESANALNGNIIYIDNYENAISNISQEKFKRIGQGRAFKMILRTSSYEIKKIHTSYSDVPDGEMVILFGTSGFLEIAINQGNAAGLLGLSIYDAIRIEFND